MCIISFHPQSTPTVSTTEIREIDLSAQDQVAFEGQSQGWVGPRLLTPQPGLLVIKAVLVLGEVGWGWKGSEVSRI